MADQSYLDTAIQQVQTPEAQAFLATLDGPESGGNYNVRFNGNTPATFDDMSRHPAVAVRIPDGWPMAGSTSDAAGAHQMLSSTWNRAAQRLGLPGAETGDAPYYPFYQDLGAWDVANTAYKQVNPNGDLLGALKSGNIEPVMQAMRDTRQWDTANPSAYFGNLAKRLQTAQGPTNTVSDARTAVPDVAASSASDDDVIRMFINGTLPGMQPPQQGAPSAAAPAAAADDPASHGAMPDVLTLTGRGTQPADVIAKAQRIRAGEDPQTVLGYTIDKPAPANGIDALAAAGSQPPAGSSPGIAALAAAGTSTNAPTVTGQGAPVTRDQLSGAAPMPAPVAPTGIDALAALGKGAQNPAPAPAAPAAGIAALAAAGNGAPAASPSASAQPGSPPAAQPFTPTFDTKGLIDSFNFYSSFPKGAPMATATLGMIEKMIPPGGYQIGTDANGNTVAQLTPGVAQGAGQIKQAETLAANQQQINPATGRVENLPGAPQAAGQVAGAKAAAEAPYRVTRGTPGTLMYDGAGNVVGATPQMVKIVDPQTGAETFQYVTPPGAPPAGGTSPAPRAPGTPPTAGASDVGAINPATGAGLPAELGPGQHAALVARADAEQKQRQLVIDQANTAQISQAGLQNMQNDIGNFQQGPFAAHTQAAAQYLRLIDPRWDGQVANYEDFVKNAGALTRTAVHDTSPRAAAQEYTMINATLPNPDMSPLGLQRVTNELMGLNDYKTVKAQAQAAWEQAHGGIGNISGFETDFQKNLSPYAFIMARMNPTDLKQMAIHLQATLQGQHQLSTMRSQLQYIKANGLDQGLQ